MDDEGLRLEISLRLKAARFLAGRRDGNRAVPLTVKELAGLPVIRENRITKNRLDDIEQMDVTARPMELEKIAEALGLPAAWFHMADREDLDATAVQTAQRVIPLLLSGVQALHTGAGPQLRDAAGPDRPAGSLGATDG